MKCAPSPSASPNFKALALSINKSPVNVPPVVAKAPTAVAVVLSKASLTALSALAVAA